jgi:hypothetical protein
VKIESGAAVEVMPVKMEIIQTGVDAIDRLFAWKD